MDLERLGDPGSGLRQVTRENSPNVDSATSIVPEPRQKCQDPVSGFRIPPRSAACLGGLEKC